MATEKPRFTITVPNELLNEIVKYQTQRNIATRSGAIQELIELGVTDLMNSGVITKKEIAETRQDRELLDLFHLLNEKGRERLLEDAEMLASSEKYSKNNAFHLA